MAVLKKTLFAENLEKYSVLIQDTDPNSKYFKITELPDTLTGGKNAFLIQGSEFLVADTIIKIEIKDSQGNIIYHEPGEGIPEYYEGTSKVIAVYVYPDTAFGPCTITILGEISEYEDSNGVRKPIPLQYKDTYNVRWQKQINVNPFLQNNTKIRFYRRPQVEITEVLKPVFTITETRVQQNGDAELFSNQQIDDLLLDRRGGYLLPDDFQYKAHLLSDTFKANMLGTTMSFTSYPDYKPEIIELVSSTEAILNTPLIENGVIQTVISTPYAITYLSGSDKKQSDFTSSYAQIKLTQLETFAGDVKRVKVFRRSKGSISDYELVQDILLESTELLRTLEGTNKAVENTGIFDANTLANYWNTDNTLTATLSNSRLVNGVKLNGNGKFKYTSSLDLTSKTVYELQFDAFYSSSTATDLDVYISGSAPSGSSFIDTEIKIGSLIGITPTKKFENQILQFKLDLNQPSASLFFSASQGEWHLSDLSLVVSQETAFSPDSVTFLTSVPTSIPNEIFEFKFEFYDVNNNFVPVTVLEEKQFSGGTNTIIVLTQLASSSLELSGSIYSASIDLTNTINAVSTSISGTVTTNSASISGTIGQVSSSVSGTIGSVSASVSGSIFTLSGSVSGTIGSVSASVSGTIGQVSSSVSGTIGVLSGSVSGSIYTLSGSVSASISNVSSSISSSLSNANSQSLYTVYSASAYLDKFIFTDANGKLRRPPTASANGLYTGDDHLGFFSNGTWKTYMDSQGDFYLTSDAVNAGFLAWSSAQGRLQILGDINIQGGNAATTSSLNSATASLLNNINTATQSLSASVAATTFTTATGLIAKPPTVIVGSTSGLYLGSSFLGYYDGAGWKTFMANNGNFYLSGSGGDSLTWAGGVLSINGAINITGGNAATSAALTSSLSSTLSSANSNAQGYANTAGTNAALSGSNAAANAALSASLSGSVDPTTQRISKANTPSGAGLYLGSNYLGYYNGSNWRTYMASTGDFYLGSISDSNYLEWNNATGILTIKGAINITGGTVQTSLNSLNSATSSLYTATSSLQSQVNSVGAYTSSIRTNSTGLINQAAAPSGAGLYLGSAYLGYYNGSGWKTYMANNGDFYLSGAGTDSLTWASGVLTINGAINITGGTAGSSLTNLNSATSSLNTSVSNLNTTTGNLQTQITSVGSYTSSIRTNSIGLVNTAAAPAGAGLYLGSSYMGYYNGSAWKTYMANNGDFALSGAGTDSLSWTGGVLTINGAINITGGAAGSALTNLNNTTSSLNSSITNINSTTSSLNTSVSNLNTTTTGLQGQLTNIGAASGSWVNPSSYNFGGSGFALANAAPAGSGLYLGANYLGYYNGSSWKSYMDNSGNFGLQGSAGYLTWTAATDALAIKGDITATNITATNTGNLAGWALTSNALSKTTGSFTLKLTSTTTSPGLVITETNAVDSFDRLRINSDLTIPAIQVSDTGSIGYGNSSQIIHTTYGTDNPPYYNDQYGPVLGDYGSINYGGGYGIIGLQYASEEIFVEAEQFPGITNVLFGDDGGDYILGYWDCYLQVTRYPSLQDAIDQTNVDNTYGYYGTQTALLASSYLEQTGGGTPWEFNTVYGGTIKAPGGGGINTLGTPKWYRVEIIQYYYLNAIGNSSFIRVRRPAGDIVVKYGRVGNGYSVFSPGGIQVYQGFKNYMNAADVSSKAAGLDAEAAAQVNFFEVKGKSGIIGSLSVSNGLSVPKGKQFKIQHPKNSDKWLYHTALESPRADLIYRGVCELNEGFASCSIDSASRMEEGTFNSFTKNPQLFLQNDSGFDRLKGNVISGSVEIYSENTQSTDIVSWMVVAERNDKDIIESPLYDKNGNYRPERFKEKYIDERKQYLKNLISGSI